VALTNCGTVRTNIPQGVLEDRSFTVGDEDDFAVATGAECAASPPAATRLTSSPTFSGRRRPFADWSVRRRGFDHPQRHAGADL